MKQRKIRQNLAVIIDETAYVHFRSKRTTQEWFIVDKQDYIDHVAPYHWLYVGNYIARWQRIGEKQELVYLHRQLLNPAEGQVSDHVNGNTLDNKRDNLRICSQLNNIQNQKLRKNNTSGYKGVSWVKGKNKWASSICVKYKVKRLGYFDSPEEAYRAYCQAAIDNHKEYANLGE